MTQQSFSRRVIRGQFSGPFSTYGALRRQPNSIIPILPFGSPTYRENVPLQRKLNSSSTHIHPSVRIVRDGETCRLLGAWIGNAIPYLTPWPSTVDKIRNDLERWKLTNPSIEGKRHIINMFVGGRSQYLTRVQGMPAEVEESLVKLIHDFVWDGKRARISDSTMHSNVLLGGKQILNIRARNEAIDLWNIQAYLTQGPHRPSWCYFVDFILAKWLENGYMHVHPGQIMNVFLQNVHLPISSETRLPDQIKRMIVTARKFKLKFVALSISQGLKLQMPIWKHPSVRKIDYDHASRRRAAACLRSNHHVRLVDDVLTIATRRTVIAQKPHRLNSSGLSRQNCACPSCQRDRVELGCQHPGKCIDTAKILINSIHPKWNPTVDNPCDNWSLTPEEMELNSQPIRTGEVMTFDPDFTLNNIGQGFRIFAFDDSLNEVPARRTVIPGDEPPLLTLFLHAHIQHAGEFNAEIHLTVKSVTIDHREDCTLLIMTFDKPNIPRSLPSALLGGLLYTLQHCPRNQPLIVCTSSDLLLRMLVKDRDQFEMDMLNPCFQLFQAVLAALNEHAGKIQFKKIELNPARHAVNPRKIEVEIDTEIDLMFSRPGIPLASGSQRLFTKIINTLNLIPRRKSTFVNLERIRCAVEDACHITPTDEMIWKSIRSTIFQRLTREFYWKCIHNVFRVGDFWTHIQNSEVLGRCHVCDVPETLEHIALECNAPERKLIWNLTSELWSRKYSNWPDLNWGLLLGCNIVQFRTSRGRILPEKGRLFAILVSVAWHEIWRLRVDRVLTHPNKIHSEPAICTQWLRSINASLSRDRILTDKIKFGKLCFNKELVLNTWSGLLLNEESLPDDWTYTKGVLVGIQPYTVRNGIG